uniref:Copia protein n=1 Tax=Anopheles atroparvus TaxID=41427 RepID=A0AAG5DUF4_ANOAO
YRGCSFLCRNLFVIKTSGLVDAKISPIPLDPGYVKREEEGEALLTNYDYQKTIGKLLYIAINTRPDIAAAVSILSRKTNRPTQTDWNEVKRVVRYLKGTIEFRLRISQIGTRDGIIGYCDSDWAENKQDRKSNSGYVFTVNGGTVSWACRKQNCVSLSTTEAELIALSEATQEAIWLRLLLKELNDEQEVLVYEDNQSCLKLLAREQLSNRTKHICTRYHFTKDQINRGEVTCVYCPSEEMIADLLTKPLARMKIQKLVNMIGLTATI